MADYYIKQGDNAPIVYCQLVDATGAGANLTGATVTLYVKLHGAIIITRSCSVVVPLNGNISFAWTTGDTVTSGTATFEFKAVYGNGDVVTFPDDRNLELQITKNVRT